MTYGPVRTASAIWRSVACQSGGTRAPVTYPPAAATWWPRRGRGRWRRRPPPAAAGRRKRLRRRSARAERRAWSCLPTSVVCDLADRGQRDHDEEERVPEEPRDREEVEPSPRPGIVLM